MDELIETMCKALAAKHYAARFGKPISDPHVQANMQANWRDQEETVRFLLLGIEASGYAVVPVEPTPEMLMKVYIDEGVNHEDAALEWTAMLAARPKVTGP